MNFLPESNESQDHGLDYPLKLPYSYQNTKLSKKLKNPNISRRNLMPAVLRDIAAPLPDYCSGVLKRLMEVSPSVTPSAEPQTKASGLCEVPAKVYTAR